MTNLPVPILASVAPGGYITSAQRNTDIVNGLGFALAPPAFSAYASTTQSMPNNTAAAVTLDTETLDTYGGHSTVTNTSRYVGQVAGYYYVSATITFATNTTGVRVCQLAKNGTLLTTGAYGAVASSSFNTSARADAIVQLNGSTDYVEMWGNQNSGGALSTVANDSQLLVWFMHT